MLNKFEKILFRLTPNMILRRLLPRLKRYHYFNGTKYTQTPVQFNVWYNQFVNGYASNVHWPVHPTSIVSNPKNIYCGIETCPGYSFGNYIQAFGKIYIGDYTQIAPNVGIISSNHDLFDNRKHIIKDIIIGKYCWIGMGGIILAGVELGDYTIVAAGAIVTKSFKEGYCVIAGNPAKIIKVLERDKCVFHKSENEYNGYIKHEEYETFRKKYLNV
jgi:hypothetical protein